MSRQSIRTLVTRLVILATPVALFVATAAPRMRF